MVRGCLTRLKRACRAKYEPVSEAFLLGIGSLFRDRGDPDGCVMYGDNGHEYGPATTGIKLKKAPEPILLRTEKKTESRRGRKWPKSHCAETNHGQGEEDAVDGTKNGVRPKAHTNTQRSKCSKRQK